MGYQAVHTVPTKWTIPPRRGYEFAVCFAGIGQRSRDDWSKPDIHRFSLVMVIMRTKRIMEPEMSLEKRAISLTWQGSLE